MTTYIILALCIIILLSYVFDITSKYSKIPGVILLIALGIGLQLLGQYSSIKIPDLKPILPVLGTIGLVLIILEASLDLKLNKRKKSLITKSISSAFVLLVLFLTGFAFIFVHFYGYNIKSSLINAIPFGIISSAVAIPSAIFLNQEEKEFIVYESSFSDLFGIIMFDFLLTGGTTLVGGLFYFAYSTLFTLIISLIVTVILGILLHRITYHISYVIIMTSILLVYVLAQLSHLPALLVIITFGMVISNFKFFENTFIKRFVDFAKFRNDLSAFRKMLSEFTFLVRSFFFIIFGFYTQVTGLFSSENVIISLAITASLLTMRLIYLKFILRMPVFPLALFIPRGLITIILFLSIPFSSNISIINVQVITLVILETILMLVAVNIFFKRKIKHPDSADEDLRYIVSEETLRLRKLEARRKEEQEQITGIL
jgi:potassium/hydrogen antiporter